MDGNDATPGAPGDTRIERTSDRKMVVTRTFNAPARIVYAAWSRPELFMRWWAPRSMGVPILSCDMDVRTGGKYRLTFGHNAEETWTFFGRYIEVIPDKLLVWTNDEGEEGAVTTVTFEEKDGKTLLTYRDLYPSKAALDDSLDGMGESLPEQFGQLDELLADPGAITEPS